MGAENTPMTSVGDPAMAAFADGVRRAVLDLPAPEVAALDHDIRRARTTAEQAALTYLAQQQCPPDLIEFGQRNGIEHFAQFTWQAGFQQGMRFAELQRLQADMQTAAGAEVLGALRKAEAEVAALKARLRHIETTAPKGASTEGTMPCD